MMLWMTRPSRRIQRLSMEYPSVSPAMTRSNWAMSAARSAGYVMSAHVMCRSSCRSYARIRHSSALTDNPPLQAEAIRAFVADGPPLIEAIPPGYRDRILAEAGVYEEPPKAPALAAEVEPDRATIKFASFEGSKGLSAQHVCVVGLHEGDLPGRPAAADDLEVCKMIVAITRTRKQCRLLYTRRRVNIERRPSPFLGWIRPERREFVNVTREYW
jgi:hypothetical protein